MSGTTSSVLSRSSIFGTSSPLSTATPVPASFHASWPYCFASLSRARVLPVARSMTKTPFPSRTDASTVYASLSPARLNSASPTLPRSWLRPVANSSRMASEPRADALEAPPPRPPPKPPPPRPPRPPPAAGRLRSNAYFDVRENVADCMSRQRRVVPVASSRISSRRSDADAAPPPRAPCAAGVSVPPPPAEPRPPRPPRGGTESTWYAIQRASGENTPFDAFAMAVSRSVCWSRMCSSGFASRCATLVNR